MYVSGLTSASRSPSSRISASCPENFERHEPFVAPRELVDDHPAGVVARGCVLAARVAETGDEQVERRGVLAPTEEAHGSASSAVPASPARARPRRRLALGLRSGLALRRSSPSSSLLAFLEPRAPRPRVGTVTVASTVSGIVEAASRPRERRGRTARSVSPISSRLTSSSISLGHLHRQRLDVYLARDLREHAALLDAGALADELDDDRGLDRLVEPDLLQVDVDRSCPRIGSRW